MTLTTCRASVVVAAAVLVLTGCTGSGLPEPQVAVQCQPGSITLEITNVGEATARYTVSVLVEREGLVETEQYSSNVVRPGETVTLDDDRPDDQEECTVTSVQVFEA